MKKVGIINFGSNNINSVVGAFEKIGCDVFIISTNADLNRSDLIVLPGVGVFPEAIKYLEKQKLKIPLVNAIKRGKKVLGICLGMQILAESSDELYFSKGLKVIPGKIKKIIKENFNIGWSSINLRKYNKIFSIFNKKEFYFNHQFKYSGPEKYIISIVGSKEAIPSVIIHKNVIGVQFHPEKSQSNGLKFLTQVVDHF